MRKPGLPSLDDKLDEALKQTFPASDAFALFPETAVEPTVLDEPTRQPGKRTVRRENANLTHPRRGHDDGEERPSMERTKRLREAMTTESPTHRRLAGEVIASGLRFPEGPIALPDGSILLVEMGRGTLTQVIDRRPEVIAHVGGGPNGAALGPDGLCYVCNNGGSVWSQAADGLLRPVGKTPDYTSGLIQRVNLSTGSVETLYTHCGDVSLKAPNDLVFDRWGGFWFTDFGRVHGRVRDLGAVYYAKADGSELKQVVFPIQAPNGIALAPDGSTLYVAETETARLWAYTIRGPGDLDLLPWPAPNGGRLVLGTAGYQRFDSMAVEQGGNVCVATLVRSGILVAAPDGTEVDFLAADDPYCTNLCFGGPELRTAFVTLSGYGHLLEVPWPRPGLALN